MTNLAIATQISEQGDDSKSLETLLLLLAHLTCADEQIHSAEMNLLLALAEEWEAGPETIGRIQEILSQDENMIPVEQLIRQTSPDHRQKAILSMYTLGYSDGNLCSAESEFISNIAQTWQLSDALLSTLHSHAQNEYLAHREHSQSNRVNEQGKASLASKLLGGADKLLTPQLVSKLIALTSQKTRQKVDRLRTELLLSGPEYDDAIRKCAKIAREDFALTHDILNQTMDELQTLSKNIDTRIEHIGKNEGKGERQSATAVKNQLQELKHGIDADLILKVQKLSTSLVQKERAVDYFTIAFIGKTKAGKSTLHAVMTGEGWDAIGVGRQRTTRYNRVYEWQNIRIIDTPGIGAPHGKSDEEIAESIIDEADVICYVVTNDSQQESEFEFMHKLKKKAKPLVIVLNVKKNLTDQRRLENFLKKPETVLKMTGPNSLEGHINRIHRYASQHYANDYFNIIPVQLLAAQLSRQPEHADLAGQLYEASRLPDFLDSLRISLIEEGPLRRSQNLLGCTARDVEEIEEWLAENSDKLSETIKMLESSRKQTKTKINQAAKNASNTISHALNQNFHTLESSIVPFANTHWEESNDKKLQSKWTEKVKALKIQKKIENSIDNAMNHFSAEVEEILQEVGNEFQLLVQLNSLDTNLFSSSTSIFVKRLLTIGGALAGTAGTIALLFSIAVPPLFIGLTAVAGLIGTFLFDSKEKKETKAVTKISETLTKEVKTWREQVTSEIEKSFQDQTSEMRNNIEFYFNDLIQGLKSLNDTFGGSHNAVSFTKNELNMSYVKRILAWACDVELDALQVLPTNVERVCGETMTVTLGSKPRMKKTTAELGRILQEDFEIVLTNN